MTITHREDTFVIFLEYDLEFHIIFQGDEVCYHGDKHILKLLRFVQKFYWVALVTISLRNYYSPIHLNCNQSLPVECGVYRLHLKM